MTDSSKYALYQELIKVVGPGLYEENDIIADYFANTSSDGPYLISEKYISFIANVFSGNVINAAEVEFHADMVGCLNFAGTDDTLTDISILIPISAGEIFTFLLTLTPSEVRDMYEAAVRADMGISEEDESGYFDYYYKLNSDIVQNQAQIHGEY